MKIKGRALSRNQRNSSSWRVDGANAKRQGELDMSLDKGMKHRTRRKDKRQKGFKSYIDKYGRLYIKLSHGKRQRNTDRIPFDADNIWFWDGWNGQRCLDFYRRLINDLDR